MTEGTNLIWQPVGSALQDWADHPSRRLIPCFTRNGRDKPVVRGKANAVLAEVYGWPRCVGGVGATRVVRECVGDSDNPDLLTRGKSLLLSAVGFQPVASGCCGACEGEQPGDEQGEQAASSGPGQHADGVVPVPVAGVGGLGCSVQSPFDGDG